MAGKVNKLNVGIRVAKNRHEQRDIAEEVEAWLFEAMSVNQAISLYRFGKQFVNAES